MPYERAPYTLSRSRIIYILKNDNLYQKLI